VRGCGIDSRFCTGGFPARSARAWAGPVRPGPRLPGSPPDAADHPDSRPADGADHPGPPDAEALFCGRAASPLRRIYRLPIQLLPAPERIRGCCVPRWTLTWNVPPAGGSVPGTGGTGGNGARIVPGCRSRCGLGQQPRSIPGSRCRNGMRSAPGVFHWCSSLERVAFEWCLADDGGHRGKRFCYSL
jgi:hypothetical protein